MDTAEISQALFDLQRQRAVVLKSRNMQATRLQAVIAGELGYRSSMPEKDRAKKYDEAKALIKAITAGEVEHRFELVVITTMTGVNAFNAFKKDLEKQMEALASELPAAAWISGEERKGFGPLSLATVVGEAGDLAGYSGPMKLWRRFGLSPWTFEGRVQMGATWRGGKGGKLPGEEWARFGYSPRRRSIVFVVGENLLKQNGDGPYRARYEVAKARMQEAHPEYPKMRCHRHGMLLATKLLLKDLWAFWNGRPSTVELVEAT